MLHTSRQAIRIIFLTIGFVLFFVLTFISASTATNKQAVAGKPHLMPDGSVGLSTILGSPTVNADSMLPTAANASAISAEAYSVQWSSERGNTSLAENKAHADPPSLSEHGEGRSADVKTAPSNDDSSGRQTTNRAAPASIH